MKKKIAIVGSRHFGSQNLIQAFVASLSANTTIVSGGAQGVDRWAVEAAQRLGLQTIIVEAEWGKLGRKAGPIRNARIVSLVDEVVAFWDGRSRGTLNTIVLASDAGLPLRVFDETGELLELNDVLEQAERRGITRAVQVARDRSHGG